ncbi:unnamed protein product, partial [Symbiodinium necroappetens]
MAPCAWMWKTQGPSLTWILQRIDGMDKGDRRQCASWRRASRLSLEAYCSNVNIAAASRSSAWRLALAALRDAAKPDLVSFNSAVAACARATKWPQALRLLGNLKAAALQADQRTWTPLLPVLPWTRALQVFGDLEERSLLDPPLLAAALASSARAHAWAATLQLLNQLRARDEGGRGFGFAVGLSAAIRSLAKASLWPVSLGLVQESRDTGRLQHDVVLLSTCLLACRAGALWQLGLCLLQAAGGAELPTAAAHNSAISACAEKSQWQAALQLLADAERLGILDVTTCNASITACDRGHAWQHAMQVLEVAKEQRVRTDAFSSAAAVSSCASATQWSLALGLVAKEPPGPFALSALVAACGAARRWEHGLAIWQGWPARKDLDHTCQNAALHLFAPLGRWVAALQVLDAMGTLGTTGTLSLEACQTSCEVAGVWPPIPRLRAQAAAKEAMLSRSGANDIEAVAESTIRLRLERLGSCLGKYFGGGRQSTPRACWCELGVQGRGSIAGGACCIKKGVLFPKTTRKLALLLMSRHEESMRCRGGGRPACTADAAGWRCGPTLIHECICFGWHIAATMLRRHVLVVFGWLIQLDLCSEEDSEEVYWNASLLKGARYGFRGDVRCYHPHTFEGTTAGATTGEKMLKRTSWLLRDVCCSFGRN